MANSSEQTISYRQVLALVGLIAVVIATLLLNYQQRSFGRGLVTIGDDIQVQVRIADSTPAREKGLSGTEQLALDEGMLFLFSEPAKYQFWMKDMLFPLDAVWIRDGEIIDLTVNVAPPQPGQDIPVFAPIKAADAVLEVPAGFAARHGLRLGLPVKYDIDKRGGLR